MSSDRNQVRQKKRDINFYQLLENLINLGLKGADFICKRIEAYYDLVNASEDLQTNINDLGQIVSKVNTRRKTKRDAVNLVKNYSSSIAMWNNTITITGYG